MINNLTKLTLSLSCALLLTYHQAQAAPQNKTATISASVAKSESTTGFDQAINFGTLTPNASGTTKTTESAVNFTSNSGTNYFITVEMTVWISDYF